MNIYQMKDTIITEWGFNNFYSRESPVWASVPNCHLSQSQPRVPCLPPISRVAARSHGCASARDRYPRPPGFSSVRVTSWCCEPSQDDRGRSLPRVIEVVRAALRASRRFDVVTATSTSNVPRENSPGCSRVASVTTGATPVPARVSFKFRSRTSRRSSARESDSDRVVCSSLPRERRGTLSSQNKSPVSFENIAGCS